MKRINSILCNSLGITSILATTIRKYITGDSNAIHHDKGRMAAVLELFENVDDGHITELLLLITDSWAQEDNRVEALLCSRFTGTSAMKYFTTTMGVQLMSGEKPRHPLQRRHFIVPLFIQSVIWLIEQHKHLGKMSKMVKSYP